MYELQQHGVCRPSLLTLMMRFAVSRRDVSMMLAELTHNHPAVLYAPLMDALLAAAADLDTNASGLDAGRTQTIDLVLADELMEVFREWLDRAARREGTSGDAAKAQAFARIRGAARERMTTLRCRQGHEVQIKSRRLAVTNRPNHCLECGEEMHPV
jgi:hypothetical protein